MCLLLNERTGYGELESYKLITSKSFLSDQSKCLPILKQNLKFFSSKSWAHESSPEGLFMFKIAEGLAKYFSANLSLMPQAAYTGRKSKEILAVIPQTLHFYNLALNNFGGEKKIKYHKVGEMLSIIFSW